MIDIENNQPDDATALVKIVKDATEYLAAPDLRGLAGDPAKPLESRNLFGVWQVHQAEIDRLRARGFARPRPVIDDFPRFKLMRFNPQLINLGDADLELGGYPSPFYARGFFFPTGASDLLLRARLVRQSDGVMVVGTNRPPVSLHWSGWYPSPDMAPARQWGWMDYILEFGLAAVPVGDPGVAGAFLDISGLGEAGPELFDFTLTFDPDNLLDQRDEVSLTLSIENLQAEVIF